jgi:hypothetical protein
MPLASVPDLERELDALFDLPLDEFTKARNELVSRLKRAHQKQAADTVRTLRKPTIVAWAANRLARREPERIGELLAAGERLRKAQEHALGGRADAEEVRAAVAAERETVGALVAAAREVLGAQATPRLLERLGQTLRAAAVDPNARDALAAGRLTEEVQGAGFGALEGLAVAPAAKRDDDAEAARAARERVTTLRKEARRLAAEAREAEAAAARAEEEARRLAEEAAGRRAEAERVATELAAAEEAAGRRR